jgi:hypothetical protein
VLPAVQVVPSFVVQSAFVVHATVSGPVLQSAAVPPRTGMCAQHTGSALEVQPAGDVHVNVVPPLLLPLLVLLPLLLVLPLLVLLPLLLVLLPLLLVLPPLLLVLPPLVLPPLLLVLPLLVLLPPPDEDDVDDPPSAPSLPMPPPLAPPHPPTSEPAADRDPTATRTTTNGAVFMTGP